MSVLARKRTLSPLQTYETAVTIRRNLMNTMLRDFSYEKLSKHKDKDGYDIYPKDTVEAFRKQIMKLVFELTTSVARANSIYPTTVADVNRRDAWQANAIEVASTLMCELNCTAELFTKQIKCFLPYVDDIGKFIAQCKKWRKSNNKYLEKIQGCKTAGNCSANSTNFSNVNNNGNANNNNAGNANGVAPDFKGSQQTE